jgi:prevent-host-death family protein
VQCKWGALSADGDVIVARLGTSRHSPTRGYVTTTYGEDEVDLFAVYCGELDQCFLLPIADCLEMRQMLLRLKPARNSQRSCINLAGKYAFDGAIAQLGERLNGIQEAVGSSPTSSTVAEPSLQVVSAVGFRDSFGDWMDRVAGGEQVIVTRRGKPRVRLSPAVGL